jgi:hypothetical protein
MHDPFKAYVLELDHSPKSADQVMEMRTWAWKNCTGIAQIIEIDNSTFIIVHDQGNTQGLTKFVLKYA